MKRSDIHRCAGNSLIVLLLALLAGCTSSRDFEYKGQTYSTVDNITIDSRRPFPIERDAWRLGPDRHAVLEGEDITIGASEDGSMIVFRMEFHMFGEKSKWTENTTERTTKVMDKIVQLLKEDGFIVTRRVAIVTGANVIGYTVGGRTRVVGFYLFAKEGAYDALLESLGDMEPIVIEEEVIVESVGEDKAVESVEAVEVVEEGEAAEESSGGWGDFIKWHY
ncbi:MAG: hypothetical protein AAFX93_14770 [Verrucomicrobiota bacterium]